MGTILFNRTPDDELKLVASTAFTDSTSSTPVNITSIGCGDDDYGLMLNVTAKAGTHDSSNKFTVTLQAGETSGGTFYTVDGVSISSDVIATGANLIAFNSRQVSEAVGTQDADYFKINVAKTGTTATGLTLSAYIVKGV